jgi:release factor glutamine methyltransferase
VSVLTYRAALDQAAAALQQAGLEQPRLEARLLLAHVLGAPRSTLPDAATPVDGAALASALARRAAHEPLAYITGRAGFWSFELAVSAATLIPRPDSETVVAAALAAIADRAGVRRVLDLGTGTGCLLLAALLECPAAFGVGVDRNPAAAALASGNAAALGLGGRAAFLAADWAAPLAARFDLVLSNPPYINSSDIKGLMPDVALYEPGLALDGGADGLAAYRVLIPAMAALLAPGGVASLEIGFGQAEATLALARAAGFGGAALTADLGGIPRALVLRA